MQQLVGVNEAGRLLGIHPSQISRGLKNGVIPNRGAPGRPLVDVDEARQARSRGLDPAQQRGPTAPLFTATRQPEPTPDEDDSPTYQGFRARREAANAEKAEIELAKMRGELLDRREVADAQFKLGRMLRDAMEQRRAALGQKLVGLELGAIMAVLADADEAHLNAIADELGKRRVEEEVSVAA